MNVRSSVIILMLVGLLPAGVALAEQPTQRDIRQVQAFFSQERAVGIGDVCFAEKVCMAGNLASDETSCMSHVSWCFANAGKTDTVSTQGLYDSMCPKFFEKLGPAEYQVIRNPTGCNVSPPAAALQPIFTENELRCVSQKSCAPSDDSEIFKAYQKICLTSFRECANDPNQMVPTKRSICRQNRRTAERDNILSSSGACRPEINPTFMRMAGPRQPIQPPRNWQEQVAREAPPKQDEFDLGDLDF